jgi:hypothetical protein
MWAQALGSGQAIYDGHAYLTQVWLECREMAVAYLQEAFECLPGRSDDAFECATVHYTEVRDRLKAVSEMHPERPDGCDWQSPLTSPEGAALIREVAEAERKGIACLRRIAEAL